jgi:cobalt-zinc-cadmium efflux system membrane fusion protein
MWVRQGEPLFSLSAPIITDAIGHFNEASAAARLAKQILSRQQKRESSHIASLQELEQAELGNEQAINELAKARAALNALNIPTSMQLNTPTFIVHASSKGYVTALNTAVGQYWNDSFAPVMVISDIDDVYINANLQENDNDKIYLGQDVSVMVDGVTKPIKAKIDYISPLLDLNTRTISAGFLFDNKNDQLKLNLFAKMTFMTRPHEGILLPLTSVIQRGFDSIVFVEVSPWVFEPKIVQTGVQHDGKIEIISGLNSKDKVALTGGIFLND